MAEENKQKTAPTRRGVPKELQNVAVGHEPDRSVEVFDLQTLQRAVTNPAQAGPEAILSLQHTAGNRAVSRLIQARLTVGPVGDSYEQEADRVAEQVMKMPTSSVEHASVQRQSLEEEEVQTKSLAHAITPLIQREAAPEEEEIQTKSLIQREAALEEEEIQTKSLIQREAAPEEEEIQTKSLIQREAAPEEEEIQAKSLIQREAAPEEEEVQTRSLLQRSSTAGIAVESNLEEQILSNRGGGNPLPQEMRSFMEPRFGSDFGDVRIHTGSESAQINRSLNARAFTQGEDIFFGQEGFNAGSNAGKELLAHELTHVVQQTGPRNLQRAVSFDEAGAIKNDGEEEEAKAGPLPQTEMEESEESPAFTKGPDDRQKVDRSSHKSETKGIHALSVGSVNLEMTQPGQDSTSREEEKADALNTGNIGMEFTNPGNLTTTAFGSESYLPKWTDAKRSEGPDSTIVLDFKISLDCPWGTNDGGHTDVASASDPVVTNKVDTNGKKVYENIANDLDPVLKSGSWVAPRSKYWSRALCERHEKFHSTDDQQWTSTTGIQSVKNYISSKTVSGENTDDQLVAVLNNAITDVKRKNMQFYNGGGSVYYAYPGEVRAFGDGKAPYTELANAIRTRGVALDKEDAAKLVEDKKKSVGFLGKVKNFFGI